MIRFFKALQIGYRVLRHKDANNTFFHDLQSTGTSRQVADIELEHRMGRTLWHKYNQILSGLAEPTDFELAAIAKAFGREPFTLVESYHWSGRDVSQLADTGANWPLLFSLLKAANRLSPEEVESIVRQARSLPVRDL